MTGPILRVIGGAGAVELRIQGVSGRPSRRAPPMRLGVGAHASAIDGLLPASLVPGAYLVAAWLDGELSDMEKLAVIR